jgi:hypothetical protein
VRLPCPRCVPAAWYRGVDVTTRGPTTRRGRGCCGRGLPHTVPSRWTRQATRQR